MKKFAMFAAAFALAFVVSSSLKAAEEGEAKAESVTGTVGCGHCSYSKETGAKGCTAAIKVGEKVMTFAAAEGASDEVKAKVKAYKTEMKGDWTLTGTVSKSDDGKESLVVTDVKPAAKEEGAKTE